MRTADTVHCDTLRHALGGAVAGRRAAFGQVTKLPSGRYRARYQVPDCSPRRYVTAPTTFGRKADADDWLAHQRADIVDGVVRPKIVASRVTLRQYAPRWLDERRNSRGEPLRATTRRSYQQYLDAYLLPRWGDIPLPKIERADFRAWFATFALDHPTLRARVYALLHAMMRSALEEEEPPLIQANPIMIRGGSQAGAPRTKKVVATPQQVDELAAAMPERLALAVYLGAWCQTRNGEAMALRRRDVTPERISITRGVTWVHGEPIFGPPKTDAGTRDIAVPPHIAARIREHLLAHANPGPDGLLFPAHPGQDRPMHQNTYAYYQAQARKSTSLPATFRYHHLRHTGLTWAAQVGGTLAELQARAGHARPSTAMLYQHSTKTRDEALAEKLSEQIAGKAKHGVAKQAGRGRTGRSE